MFEVDEYLRVEGHTNVFAIGDCADTNDPKAARTAYFCHAPAVAKSIIAIDRGKPPITPSPLMNALMVPVGPFDGAGYFGETSIPDWMVVAAKSKEFMASRVWAEVARKKSSLSD